MTASDPTLLPKPPADESSLQEQDCVSLEDRSLPAGEVFSAQLHQAAEQENAPLLYIP